MKTGTGLNTNQISNLELLLGNWREDHSHIDDGYKKLYDTKSPNLKIPQQESYDESLNFEKFEQICFEANNWFMMTGFPKKYRVCHVKSMLKGCAGQFYMTFVVPKIKTYTMQQLGCDLFNYCFPPTF